MKSKSKSEQALLFSCFDDLDLSKKLFKLLMRATSDINLSIELLEKIHKVTAEHGTNYVDTEGKIKLILQKSLDRQLLEQAEVDSVNECQLAIVELMAVSHALAKTVERGS